MVMDGDSGIGPVYPLVNVYIMERSTMLSMAKSTISTRAMAEK